MHKPKTRKENKYMHKKLTTTVLLAGTSVAAIHGINRVHTSLCTIKNLLNNSENYYYEWRFGKIRYQKKGSGSPLLFIHDLTVGSSNYEFHRLINNLTEKHEVYSLHLLGYGMSDKPAMTYTNNLYEQLITDFIKNVIGRKTSVVVTGESVPFVIMSCHNYPDIFNKMIYINPQSLYLQNQIPSRQTSLFKLLIESPVIGTFIYHLFSNRPSIEKAFYQTYFYNPEEVREKYIYNYLEAAHLDGYNAKYAFASYAGKYMNMNILYELKGIDNSILMIGGEEEKDIKTTIENYKYYNAAIEDVYIKETKHLPQLENPDAVLEQINMFL